MRKTWMHCIFIYFVPTGSCVSMAHLSAVSAPMAWLRSVSTGMLRLAETVWSPFCTFWSVSASWVKDPTPVRIMLQPFLTVSGVFPRIVTNWSLVRAPVSGMSAAWGLAAHSDITVAATKIERTRQLIFILKREGGRSSYNRETCNKLKMQEIVMRLKL